MTYPKIGGVLKKKKNTSAKCKCGAVAKYKSTVQVNVFRGDDEVFWACDEHKNDSLFLLTDISKGTAQ
ncbi:hypothetical protein [Serratia fonticola]|uniref:Uncharacterized protein n=1 Tax=Serratia fonticola TaxID=47917 RepID=A0AAW3WU16_SERFO|nr:hypothetical protein [Serratia fonticola]MBC3214276.1 hypothetical protein [Serratia fonticola]NYA13667.1 hypothetical protein [Serratia fonticola]NYA35127.1 hypothetical protein [Serratia fonticola]